MTTFAQRLLAFTFTLKSGTFASGKNTLRVAGLRASAQVTCAGTAGLGEADVAIHGLTLSDMVDLSTLGQLAIYVKPYSISIEAGDTSVGMSVLFQGQISNAWVDFGGMPNNVFHVKAGAGLLEQVQPIPPTTFNGMADVATIMSGLANQSGRTFENFGVQQTLSNPYFPGTIMDQIRAVAEHADINCDLTNKKLTIWPRGQPRGSEIPLISEATGLVGFPTFSSYGIEFQVLYNPSLNVGTRVQVESKIKNACGLWDINHLVHALDTKTPAGQWFTRFVASAPGYTVVSH